MENVDGVAELRKRTGSKTSSYENNSNVMHDSAMNKITIFIAYILLVLLSLLGLKGLIKKNKQILSTNLLTFLQKFVENSIKYQSI